MTTEPHGTVLGDVEIRELCQGDNPLISEAPDFEAQLQPCGFDVTVRKITRLAGKATLGAGPRSRVAREIEQLPEAGAYRLTEGSYLAYINEYTNIPNTIMGVAYPRSTLFRAGGVLQSGIWDGGFRGRGMLGLLVVGVDELSIELMSPIAQLAFFRAARVEKGFQFNDLWRT